MGQRPLSQMGTRLRLRKSLHTPRPQGCRERSNRRGGEAWVPRGGLRFVAVFHPQGEHRSQQERAAANGKSVDRFSAEEAAHQKTEERGGDNLRNHDEEIEYAHVVAHLRRRQRSREDGVRHREDAGPGNAYSYHGSQQQPWVIEHEDREESERTTHEADRVRDLSIGTPRKDRNCEGDNGGDAVVGAEADPYPVGSLIVDSRRRVSGAIEMGGYRRRRVDPHGEEREPGEELDPGQLLHGAGYVLKVVH